MYLSAGPVVYLAAEQDVTGPEAAAFIGLMLGVLLLVGGGVAAWLEIRKTKILAGQEDALRQLVSRYEQLAANIFDTQQRVSADVAELRSRTASIEQILRTVE